MCPIFKAIVAGFRGKVALTEIGHLAFQVFHCTIGGGFKYLTNMFQLYYTVLLGVVSNIFVYFHPYLGEMIAPFD